MNITPEQIDHVLKNQLQHKTPVKVSGYTNGLGWRCCWIFADDGWAHGYGTCIKGTSTFSIRRTRWFNAKTKKIIDKHDFREVFGTDEFV